jgi:Cft2 family RNA processing exonuclease
MITCKECKYLNKQCEKCRAYQEKYRKSHRKEFNRYSAKYYAKHKEIIRAKDLAKRVANPEKYRIAKRATAIKRKYGIDYDDFIALLKSQNNKCGVCKTEFSKNVSEPEKLPCIDHDHKTGKIRGILCRKCNRILEIVEDKVLAGKANIYLNKFVK